MKPGITTSGPIVYSSCSVRYYFIRLSRQQFDQRDNLGLDCGFLPLDKWYIRKWPYDTSRSSEAKHNCWRVEHRSFKSVVLCWPDVKCLSVCSVRHLWRGNWQINYKTWCISSILFAILSEVSITTLTDQERCPITCSSCPLIVADREAKGCLDYRHWAVSRPTCSTWSSQMSLIMGQFSSHSTWISPWPNFQLRWFSYGVLPCRSPTQTLCIEPAKEFRKPTSLCDPPRLYRWDNANPHPECSNIDRETVKVHKTLLSFGLVGN